MPLSLPHYLCSLGNDLCGQFFRGQGTYTAEGITKLCERLKESAVTSLKCAAAQVFAFFCQRPLTLPNTSLLSRARSLRYNGIGPEGGAALAEGLKGNSTL